MIRRLHLLTLVAVFTATLTLAGCRSADEQESRDTQSAPQASDTGGNAQASADWPKQARDAVAKGNRYLLSVQGDDGSWFGDYGPAITALAAKCLIQGEYALDHPDVRKALDFITKAQVLDESSKMHGSFTESNQLANYNTAICLSTLALANRKAEGKPYDANLKAGLAFLRRDQWDESEGIAKDNAVYGGFGYGSHERPDMSNTNTTMDALQELKESGYISQDDPMFDKVRVFVQRTQNRSESNDGSWGQYKIGDDGGFIYAPASSPDPEKAEGESKAGSVDLPGATGSTLQSYGSMTYAGFKSYVYSGLSTDDPRVKAAWDWISRHYTLNVNPGLPEAQQHQGLYYYFHTFARALNAAETDTITDPAGVKHAWRADLTEKLSALQNEDGSWVNDKADRWEEGNPQLATCFAVLALEETLMGADSE